MFPPKFQTADGLTLQTFTALPTPGPASASVIVLHGLGDYGRASPYRNLAQALTARGLAVYGFDQRGHGHSDGERLYINAWRELREDVGVFVQLVRGVSEGRPVFLLGLSLGGLLALNYAEHQPAGLAGVVAVAPAVDSSGVSVLMRAAIPLIARVAPRLSLTLGLDLKSISRDAAAAQAYAEDPLLNLGKSTPRMAAEVLRVITETQANAPNLRLPLLILHGAEDKIVPPAGSAEFFQKAGAPDKARHVYEGAYHNLFLETNRAEVFDEIAGWLKAQCESDSPLTDIGGRHAEQNA